MAELLSKYSGQLVAQPPYDDNAPQSLTVLRRTWGVLQLNWEAVPTEIKIVRKLFDYAANIYDGEVVYSGSGTTHPSLYSTSTGLTATTLTDSSMSWEINSLSDREISPDITDSQSFLISSNTSNALTIVDGDMTKVASIGDSYWIKPLGQYIDENIEAYNTYYYVLFYKDIFGTWITKPSLRGHKYTFIQKGTAIDDYPAILANLFPSMYNLEDVPEDSPTKMNSMTDIVMSLILADMEGAAHFWPQVYDADIAPGEYLALIAEELGIEPNDDLPYMQQRAEIKSIAAFYSRKGRTDAIETYLSAVAGTDVKLGNWPQNILVYNYPDRTYMDFKAPDSGFNLDMEEDRVSRILDFSEEGSYNTVSYGVYVHINQLYGVSMPVKEKILRVATKFTPATTSPKVIFVDSPYTEISTIYDDTKHYQDEIYSVDAESVLVYDSSYDILNPSDYERVCSMLIYNNVNDRYNQLNAVYFVVHCTESWWDEIS
jgi:hypothetical protein